MAGLGPLFPKQLLPLMGEQSLLQQTAKRLPGDLFEPGADRQRRRPALLHQAPASRPSGAPVEAILLEPAARNTSAAAALAAAWLQSRGSDELMLLMPSDHVIADADAFVAAVETGIPHAEEGAIVTFGAKPTEPNTQFGYIEADAGRPFPDGASPIARFVEKPDAQTAAEYVESGRYFWNSGIFLMKAASLARRDARVPAREPRRDPRRGRQGQRRRPVCPARGGSLRQGAEHLDRPWRDGEDQPRRRRAGRNAMVGRRRLGCGVEAQRQGSRQATQSRAMRLRSTRRNSLLRTDGKAIVAAIGLDKMAVIAVRDAVFVAPMERVAEVKVLVDALKADERDCAMTPTKVARPWGSYETIGDGQRYQVKHIIVDPGETLSLQMHYHRSEHWVVVRGSAKVTVGRRGLDPAGKRVDLHPGRHAPSPRQSRQGAARAGRDSVRTISRRRRHRAVRRPIWPRR